MIAAITILFAIGLFFTLTGIIGVLRLPDFYSRLHAVGKSDTLGVTLMLGALALQQGWTVDTLKILVILGFIAIANPLITHALGRAAWKTGIVPWQRKEDTE